MEYSMKKIIMSTLIATTFVSSAMALDLIGENERVFIQAGLDVEGERDDSFQQLYDTNGNPMNNPGRLQGTSQKQAFEVSIGLEEQVSKSEFGSRKIITFYDAGKITRYDGTYKAYNKNLGLEGTYEIYYNFNKYIRPSVGAGVGINLLHHYDDGWREINEYSPTLHVSAGISGEIYKNLGYYVNFKYRFANNSTRTVPIDRAPGLIQNLYFVRVKLDGAEGGKALVGLSYKF
jgi:hypothetical protein